MKKLLIGLIALVTFISCTGPDGLTYQKYWWTGSLGYIYDTNPSTPSTIYNDVYFSTNPGNYYMEYQAWNGSEWYMYYQITAEEGKAFNTAGADSWFEIGLYSTGPILYKFDSARNVQSNDMSMNSMTSSSFINKKIEQLSTGKIKSEILGTDTKITPYGSIMIRYGKILED